jgi:tRNA/tmRNA/rRNA uracil-C5-methylase (TrmA/RlmC/RlmD family)
MWHIPEGGILTHLAGESGLPEAWGDAEFAVGGKAFLQVNRRAAKLLEEHVAEVAGNMVGLKVVDAYCGIGAHGRELAARGAHVTGIELDPNAAIIARSLSPASVAILEGRVEDHLPACLPADLVILNPPRAGVHEATIGALNADPPRRIIYISCDPATLARDVRTLSDWFTPESIRCFDMFPQTAHVETVLALGRRREPAS